MKIAFVSAHASPLTPVSSARYGGLNVHVSELARALGTRGHQVTVYTRRDSPSLRDRVRMCRGVTVEHLPAGPPKAVRQDKLLAYMSVFGRCLADRWQRDSPDVVHAHFWMSGLAALGGAQGLGIPVIQTFHALGVVERRYQGPADTSPESRIRLEVTVARSAAQVLAASSQEVAELARLGVDGRRVSVIPGGVDVGVFRPDGRVARRGPARRLLAAGRLVKRMDLDTVLQALGDVPDAELVIAGGSPGSRLRADPEYRRLSRIAADLGLSDRVSFRGRVSRADMPALMRSADLLVSVPRYEPFGLVPLEAMACGVPVVASAVGGHNDTVVDGVTGVLVPPGQPSKLARVLKDLLTGDTLPDYSAAAVERARERYSWAQIAQETAAAYARIHRAREAVRGRPAGRPVWGVAGAG